MMLAEHTVPSIRSPLENSIYVIHAFQKKSKAGIATPKFEIDRVQHRLQQLRS